MLQNIRESMTGPIAWFIVGLIVLPFAFWGVDQFNTGGCLLYTSPSPRDRTRSRMPSSA